MAGALYCFMNNLITVGSPNQVLENTELFIFCKFGDFLTDLGERKR